MKSGKKLYFNDLNRMAFLSYFEAMKVGGGSLSEQARSRFLREAARYFVSVQYVKRRLDADDVRNALAHIRLKVLTEYGGLYAGELTDAMRNLQERLGVSSETAPVKKGNP